MRNEAATAAYCERSNVDQGVGGDPTGYGEIVALKVRSEAFGSLERD